MKSPEEEADLQKLQAAIQKRKIDCYDSLIACCKTPKEQMQYTGYKDVPEMVMSRLKSYELEIRTLTKHYLTKYPDR